MSLMLPGYFLSGCFPVFAFFLVMRNHRQLNKLKPGNNQKKYMKTKINNFILNSIPSACRLQNIFNPLLCHNKLTVDVAVPFHYYPRCGRILISISNERERYE